MQEGNMIVVCVGVNGGVINDQFRKTSRNRAIIRWLESVKRYLHVISAYDIGK